MNTETRAVWGVIGGMGPIVSAELMRTIYEGRAHRVEQDLPRVILLSDPTMPDRTAALSAEASTRELARRLECGLRAVQAAGATHTAICCLTVHAVLSRLPEDLHERLVSLVDLTIDALIASPGRRHLVLCTTGSRENGVFESHPRWDLARGRVRFPSLHDQRVVHDIIYDLKAGHLDDAAIVGHGRTIRRLLLTYDADAYVVGCTELHLIAKRLPELPCVDPLGLLADLMQEGDAEPLRWAGFASEGDRR